MTLREKIKILEKLKTFLEENNIHIDATIQCTPYGEEESHIEVNGIEFDSSSLYPGDIEAKIQQLDKN